MGLNVYTSLLCIQMSYYRSTLDSIRDLDSAVRHANTYDEVKDHLRTLKDIRDEVMGVEMARHSILLRRIHMAIRNANDVLSERDYESEESFEDEDYVRDDDASSDYADDEHESDEEFTPRPALIADHLENYHKPTDYTCGFIVAGVVGVAYLWLYSQHLINVATN